MHSLSWLLPWPAPSVPPQRNQGESPVIPTQAGIQAPLLQLLAAEELSQTKQSSPGSFMKKHLQRSWPHGKGTPPAANQRRCPQVTPCMGTPYPLATRQPASRNERGNESTSIQMNAAADQHGRKVKTRKGGKALSAANRHAFEGW